MCMTIKAGTPKPSDIVPQTSIAYDELGNIRIDLTRLNIPFTVPPIPHWPVTPGTKSMLPTFGAGHNNLFLEPVDEINHSILVDWLAYQTNKGYRDIIVYQIPGQNPIVHRVVKCASDQSGRYFKCKGDNILYSDPGRIRDEHIKYISAGIIF